VIESVHLFVCFICKTTRSPVCL